MNMQLNGQKLDSYLLGAIALVTLAVFSPVLWHEFVNFDDSIIIYANPHIKSGVTFNSLYWAFTTVYETNWIPLTWISHMLDVQMFGMHAAGHHLTSVLFHVTNSVLLFLFFNKATRAPYRSAAVAFLFALHPLHVQSVAWAAERKDVLSAFFWLLTLNAYLGYSEKRSMARYVTVILLFCLGLLSKPMIVTLPAVLLLIDWWPLGRYTDAPDGSVIPARTVVSLFLEKIPFFLLSAGTALITVLAQRNSGGIVTDYTFLERLSRIDVSYIEYLEKTFWPGRLSVFYPFVGTPPSSLLVAGSLLALLLILMTVVLSRKRYPFLVTGWLWYVVTLLPVIGLIQVGDHSIADRYTYLPLIGIFVMMVWGVSQLAEGWRLPRNVLGITSALLLAGMICVTSLEISHWKNSFTLLSHAVEVTEKNWLALNNLGQAYLNVGRVDDALWCFSEAVKAKPSSVLALVNLGALYVFKQEYDRARLVLSQALNYEPNNEKAKLLLAVMAQQK
ncbi:MAG TPA: tetratricopeptide repeat protein [Desulfuromonadales bacterium]|nr:tetratricopeptide repeat protein [Desulfuromonadales bacterium]